MSSRCRTSVSAARGGGRPSTTLVLAAVDRAQRHRPTPDSGDPTLSAIAEHLGHDVGAGRLASAAPDHRPPDLRARLAAALAPGRPGPLGAQRRRLGAAWRAPAAEGVFEELPESSQHREWRAARAHAAARIEGLQGELGELLPRSSAAGRRRARGVQRMAGLQWKPLRDPHEGGRDGELCLRERAEPDDAARRRGPRAAGMGWRHPRVWDPGPWRAGSARAAAAARSSAAEGDRAGRAAPRCGSTSNQRRSRRSWTRIGDESRPVTAARPGINVRAVEPAAVSIPATGAYHVGELRRCSVMSTAAARACASARALRRPLADGPALGVVHGAVGHAERRPGAAAAAPPRAAARDALDAAQRSSATSRRSTAAVWTRSGYERRRGPNSSRAPCARSSCWPSAALGAAADCGVADRHRRLADATLLVGDRVGLHGAPLAMHAFELACMKRRTRRSWPLRREMTAVRATPAESALSPAGESLCHAR